MVSAKGHLVHVESKGSTSAHRGRDSDSGAGTGFCPATDPRLTLRPHAAKEIDGANSKRLGW